MPCVTIGGSIDLQETMAMCGQAMCGQKRRKRALSSAVAVSMEGVTDDLIFAQLRKDCVRDQTHTKNGSPNIEDQSPGQLIYKMTQGIFSVESSLHY